MQITGRQTISHRSERARFRDVRSQKFKDCLYKIANDIAAKATYLFTKAGYKLQDSAISSFNSVVTDHYVDNLHSDFADEISTVTSANPGAMARANEVVADTKIRVNNRTEFISTLEKIDTSLQAAGNHELSSKIKNVIAVLSQETDQNLDLNIVENACVSVILKAVFRELSTETTSKIEQLNALKLIEIIEHKADLGFAHIRSEKLIDQFDEIYKPLFRPGYSKSTTFEGSAGISGGYDVHFAKLEATLNANGKKKWDWFVNDLGYVYIRKTTHSGGSFEANADFGVMAEFDVAGVKIGAKASASLTLDRTTMWGEIYELKDSRAFSIYMLPELTRDMEHRNDPKIAPYLSKSSLLAHAMADYGISENILLWATTRGEVESINALKKKSDLLRNHHDMLQSLLLTSIPLDPENDGTEVEGKVTALSTIKNEKLIALQKLSFIEETTEEEIETLIQQAKTPEIKEELNLLKRLKLEQNEALQQNIVRRKTDKKPVTTTPIAVSTATAGVASLTGWSGKIESAVKAEVGVGGVENAASAEVIFKPYWYKENKARDINYTPLCRRLADPTKSAEEKAKIKQQLATEFSLFRDTILKTWTKDIFKPWKKDIGPMEREPDLTDEKVLFQFLKEDFDFYSGLQVRGDEKSLASFQQRYGADTKEQLLHRMIIANAYLFSHSKNEELKASMLDFERAEPDPSQPPKPSLLSPTFDVDAHYMKEHAMYQYEMDFEIIEHQYMGAEYALSALGGFTGTFKHEVIERERKHNEPLFDGHYIDYRFSVGGTIGNINALTQSVTSWVKKDYPELADDILADMTTALDSFELVGSTLRERTFLLQYYKPNAFGGKIPMKKLFYRELTDEKLEFGGKPKLNGAYIGIPASLKAGVKYTEATTKNKRDVFLTDTFINVFRVAMHDYDIGLIDKKSGEIAANSTWARIKQEEEAFFRKIFSKYALELESNKSGANSLSLDLVAIQKELHNNPNLSSKDKAAFLNAFDVFKRDVQAFNKDKTSTRYSLALKSLDAYIHRLYPHLSERRRNSSYYKEGHVPKLELSKKESSKAYAEKRVQEARLATLFNPEDQHVPYILSMPYHDADHYAYD